MEAGPDVAADRVQRDGDDGRVESREQSGEDRDVGHPQHTLLDRLGPAGLGPITHHSR